MYSWTIGALAIDALEHLAQILALYVRKGDLILLQGDLGAGKSTFARALIRALANDDALEVQSPTFPLLQSYDTRRVTVHHFDLYRLSGSRDLRELGFDEAVETGIALVEWPEAALDALPDDGLRVEFADGPSPDLRKLRMAGWGAFAGRLAHIQAVAGFVQAQGWGLAHAAHVAGDASRRSYARLTHAGRTCLLMDSPPLADGPPLKDGKPYWAIARLAPTVRQFTQIAPELEGYGLTVPRILAQDLGAGLLLVEDLGERSFADALAHGAPMDQLYGTAAGCLADLTAQTVPDWLPNYDMSALLVEARLLIDWFWPYVHGTAIPQAVGAEFQNIWLGALAAIETHKPHWVLRDFHSPNLFWLPERGGARAVGIIDFQDAVAGHEAYDLAALLQDARIDVPANLENDLLGRYLAQRQRAETGFDAEAFRQAYALLGAQRATKILGIFVRLAQRDDKPAYLAHLPRVAGYLRRNLLSLNRPQLQGWYSRYLKL